MTTDIRSFSQALPILEAHGKTPIAAGNRLWQVGAITLDKGGVIALANELAAGGPILSESLQERARRYVAARKRSGDALLEAVAELAAARAEADHGTWGIFLAAVGLDESRARAQIRIHEECQLDPELEERIRSGWLSEAVARELLPAPPEVRAEILARDEPPKLHEVREAKRASTPVLDQQSGAPDEPPTDDEIQAMRARFVALGYEQFYRSDKGWTAYDRLRGASHYATWPDVEAAIARTSALIVGQRADPNQPDPKAPPAASPEPATLAAPPTLADQRAELEARGWAFIPTESPRGWLRLDHPEISYVRQEPTIEDAIKAAADLQGGYDRKAQLRQQAAERQAAIAAGAPSIPDDIRQAAGRLELLIETRPDGFLLHWPEEDTSQMDPLDADLVREWLEEAPGLALARLARLIGDDLQKAGYYWESATPPTIAHNDGWRGDAPTSDGALGLARSRMEARATAPGQRPNAPRGWVWRDAGNLRRIMDGTLTKRYGDPAAAVAEAEQIDRDRPLSTPALATSGPTDLLEEFAWGDRALKAFEALEAAFYEKGDARPIAIGCLKLIEAVMDRLPKTELIEDLSRSIADLNECEEGTEWAHWSGVGWALLDMEASD